VLLLRNWRGKTGQGHPNGISCPGLPVSYTLVFDIELIVLIGSIPRRNHGWLRCL